VEAVLRSFSFKKGVVIPLAWAGMFKLADSKEELTDSQIVNKLVLIEHC
jgi:hypothetical protein